LKPKLCFKRYYRVCRSDFSHDQNILFALEENASIGAPSLMIPVRRPTLIDLVLPLATLIGITRKMKQLLTYTQDTTRASLRDYAK
jgi:hypothetical protein